MPISFPFFVMEKLPSASKDEIDAIRQHSRNAYAEPWQTRVARGDTKPEDDPEPPEENDPDDPAKPSPEL